MFVLPLNPNDAFAVDSVIFFAIFTASLYIMPACFVSRQTAFLSGGAGLSREHAHDDFKALIEERGAELVGFSYTSTLLGLTLTQKKLHAAEEFARNIAKRLNP